MTREGSIYGVCGTFCRLLWVAINRDVVPGAGIEPARYFYRGILSPLCLPISPPGLRVYGVCRDPLGTIWDYRSLNRIKRGHTTVSFCGANHSRQNSYQPIMTQQFFNIGPNHSLRPIKHFDLSEITYKHLREGLQ